MSMLAEPKRKQKIGLNPRGTLWSKDESKLGQKLLEKMGWSKGKGLGKEEQGMKDPIKVSSNSNQKGMGFKGKDDEWIQHYDAFEEVLASLNQGDEVDNENEDTNSKNVESLELQSERSKSRVHYKKFTQGKDLSRYNEEDLACVLGSKRSMKLKKDKEKEKQIEEENQKEIGDVEHTQGVTSIHGGNLREYFNKKMEELKKAREDGLIGSSSERRRTRSSSQTPDACRIKSIPQTPLPDLEFEPMKSDFSFNYSIPNESYLQEEVDNADDFDKSHQKKNKGKKKKAMKYNNEANNNEEMESDNKTKSKKDKKKKKIEADSSIDTKDNEPTGKSKRSKNSENNKLPTILNEDNDVENFIKKKKTKNSDKSLNSKECIIEENDSSLNLSTKKKKKNKDIDVESPPETDKKSKKRKRNVEDSLNDDMKENMKIEEELNYQKTVKSKKQKSNNNVIDDDENDNKKSNKKDKKEKKVKDEIGNANDENENNYNTEKRNKKRKRSPQMNDSYLVATSLEPKKKKDKNKENFASVENDGELKIKAETKTSKKLRKFASDVVLVADALRLTDTLRSKKSLKNTLSSSSENLNFEQTSDKPKTKLSKKRSFRELTNEISDKIKEKIKKTDKNKLQVIEENDELDNESIDSVKVKRNKSKTLEPRTESSSTVSVNLKSKNSREKSEILTVDLEKHFPGSNLGSIEGYDRN